MSTPAPVTRIAAKSGEQPGDGILQMRDIRMRFGENEVLKGISLELRRAEVFGLLGQNGSGKSTLIKVLAGFNAPGRGSAIRLWGRDLALPVDAAEMKRRGVAFVHPAPRSRPEPDRDREHGGRVGADGPGPRGQLAAGGTAHRGAVRRFRPVDRSLRRRRHAIPGGARLRGHRPRLRRPPRLGGWAWRRGNPCPRRADAVSAGGRRRQAVCPHPVHQGQGRLGRHRHPRHRRGARHMRPSRDPSATASWSASSTSPRRAGRRSSTRSWAVPSRLTAEHPGRSIARRRRCGCRASRAEASRSWDIDVAPGETVGLTGLIGSGFADVPYLLYGARPGRGRMAMSDRIR